MNIFVFADPSGQNVCPFSNMDKRRNIYLKLIGVKYMQFTLTLMMHVNIDKAAHKV